MLYVDLPAGGAHGWGVVGDNLAEALARLTPVERLLDESLESPPQQSGALLQSITRPHLRPRRSPVGYTRHVGYCVFERDLEARRAAPAVRDIYDVLVAASRWGEQALREGGLTNVTTIHHGVDTTRFHAAVTPGARRLDEFVVFSGGKLELRKGQDVVLRAFGLLAQRHADVRLIAAWHNPWPRLTGTMSASPYYPFTDSQSGTTPEALTRWIVSAGVDPARVTLVPFCPNVALPGLYAASDVGLFPNRCEGSTNLVMMEYMACGRPVIVTDFSGHRDVVTTANGIPLRGWRLQPIVEDGALVACWCEPDVEEILEALEQAYQDRDRLARLGEQAARDMSQWTWDKAARLFLNAIYPSRDESAGQEVAGTVSQRE